MERPRPSSKAPVAKPGLKCGFVAGNALFRGSFLLPLAMGFVAWFDTALAQVPESKTGELKTAPPKAPAVEVATPEESVPTYWPSRLWFGLGVSGAHYSTRLTLLGPTLEFGAAPLRWLEGALVAVPRWGLPLSLASGEVHTQSLGIGLKIRALSGDPSRFRAFSQLTARAQYLKFMTDARPEFIANQGAGWGSEVTLGLGGRAPLSERSFFELEASALMVVAPVSGLEFEREVTGSQGGGAEVVVLVGGRL